jgi:hypothetical protein
MIMADRKSELWHKLKGAGAQFSRPYVQYKLAELEALNNSYEAWLKDHPNGESPDGPPVSERHVPQKSGPQPNIPVVHRDPDEMAGQRLNTKADDEPIRIDPDTGRIWYQEEVRKPANAKPRGRRVITQRNQGVKTVTVNDSKDTTETFEIAGDGHTQTTVIKVTLPSWQVGKYRDKRFPFMIITYGGAEGFDLFEVEKFYGGPEMVPPSIKRIYVANTLCYDIRLTIQAIQTEDRRNQLARGAALQ